MSARLSALSSALAVMTVLVVTPGRAAGAARAGAPPSATGKPASEPERRARHLYEAAESHFRAGLFAEALGEYQAGYEAAALPGFLVNIAQCQRRLGDLGAALATYRKFIMVAPDSPFVPQVRALIADLEKLSTDLAREGQHDPETPEKAAGASGSSGGSPSLGVPENTTLPAGAALVDSTPSAPSPQHSSMRWWVIGGVALAAVAGGTAAIFALRSGDTVTAHEGTLGSLRR